MAVAMSSGSSEHSQSFGEELWGAEVAGFQGQCERTVRSCEQDRYTRINLWTNCERIKAESRDHSARRFSTGYYQAAHSALYQSQRAFGEELFKRPCDALAAVFFLCGGNFLGSCRRIDERCVALVTLDEVDNLGRADLTP